MVSNKELMNILETLMAVRSKLSSYNTIMRVLINDACADSGDEHILDMVSVVDLGIDHLYDVVDDLEKYVSVQMRGEQ